MFKINKKIQIYKNSISIFLKCYEGEKHLWYNIRCCKKCWLDIEASVEAFENEKK